MWSHCLLFFSWLLLHRKIFSMQILCLTLFAIRKFLKSPKTTDPNKKKLHIFPIFTNIVTHQYMVQSNQFNAKFYMYTTCVYSETKNVYWCHNQYNTKTRHDTERQTKNRHLKFELKNLIFVYFYITKLSNVLKETKIV